MIIALMIICWVIGLFTGIIACNIAYRHHKYKVDQKSLTICTNNLDEAERVLTVLRSDTLKMINDIIVKDVKSIWVTIKVLGEFEGWRNHEC